MPNQVPLEAQVAVVVVAGASSDEAVESSSAVEVAVQSQTASAAREASVEQSFGAACLEIAEASRTSVAAEPFASALAFRQVL